MFMFDFWGWRGGEVMLIYANILESETHLSGLEIRINRTDRICDTLLYIRIRLIRKFRNDLGILEGLITFHYYDF